MQTENDSNNDQVNSDNNNPNSVSTQINNNSITTTENNIQVNNQSENNSNQHIQRNNTIHSLNSLDQQSSSSRTTSSSIKKPIDDTFLDKIMDAQLKRIDNQRVTFKNYKTETDLMTRAAGVHFGSAGNITKSDQNTNIFWMFWKL